MNSNSENPVVGARFQKMVAEWFRDHYKIVFVLEKKIPIGITDDEKKDHKFDIVAEDDSIAVECKCYTWTVTGNVPSAKMGFTNEAAFYLSLLPDTYEKFIVMLKAPNSKRGETLAEYYYRTNRHLLGTVKVAEYDPDTNKLIVVEDKT